MKQTILTIALMSAIPAIYAQTDQSGGTEQNESTMQSEDDSDDLEATGGRDMDDAGSPSQDDNSDAPETVSSEQTIAELAKDADNLSTLSDAIAAAKLGETLQGPGSYTVFAPSNAAFEALPDGELDRLMMKKNREMLRDILLSHVVSGIMTTEQVRPGKLEAISGEELQIQVADDNVMVDNATIETTDIMASNGVIHVIDTVILPEETEEAEETQEME